MPAARVVIAESFARSGEAVLRGRGIDVTSCVGAERARLEAELAIADGLIVRSETRVDRALLESAPRLRVVGRAGVGVDTIDLDAATQAGILVLNTPSANTIAAAEHTFALLLSLFRHIPQADRSLREGRWQRAPFTGNELFGKRLGIVGLGRIGTAVAARARAFGMIVCAHDPYVSAARAESAGANLVPLEQLLELADVVTLHVPLTEQTKRMIGRAELGMMKREAVLVNCARGGIVDEEALLDALDEERLQGAALDVVAGDPPAPGSPGALLQRHPRVVATPHLGGSTHEALERIATQLANDMADALAGKPASGAVNAPAPSGPDSELVRAFAAVADSLGRAAAQLFGEALARPISMHLLGDLAQSEAEPLRAAFLAAFLQSTTDRRVSTVNSLALARELGVELETIADAQKQGFSSVLAVSFGQHRIAGSVIGNLSRIVQIDGYELDVEPKGLWIVTRHQDVPGMVGRIGTMLGKSGVNIAAMQVSRVGGSSEGEAIALMVLAVDRMIDRDLLDAMRAVPGMHRVATIAY